jgi:RHS repeat-associated protein
MSAPTQKTVLCRYHYDPLDRLADHTAPSAQEGVQRFYCKDRLSTEIQAAIQTSVFQNGEQLLAQRQSRYDQVDTTLLATDRQYSVLATLDGARPSRLAYAPYGHRTAGNGLLSLLGFNGERPDSMTGHYLLGNGYRAFNPVLMRFNSPDSWSPFAMGGLNAYAYGIGDPVNRRDPTGHLPVSVLLTKLASNRFGRVSAALTITGIVPFAAGMFVEHETAGQAMFYAGLAIIAIGGLGMIVNTAASRVNRRLPGNPRNLIPERVNNQGLVLTSRSREAVGLPPSFFPDYAPPRYSPIDIPASRSTETLNGPPPPYSRIEVPPQLPRYSLQEQPAIPFANRVQRRSLTPEFTLPNQTSATSRQIRQADSI